MLFVSALSIHHLFGGVRRSEAGIDNNEAVARGAMVVKWWSNGATAMKQWRVEGRRHYTGSKGE